MKYVKICIIFIASLSLLAAGIFLILNLKQNNQTVNKENSPGELPVENKQPDTTIESTSQETVKFESLTYDFEHIVPMFEVLYPSDWETVIDIESGGTFDIISRKETETIYIDYTGMSVDSFDYALSRWLTNFGSYEDTFIKDVIKSNEEKDYIIYDIRDEATSEKFYFGIRRVSKVNTGPSPTQGFLAVRDDGQTSLNLIEEILNSARNFDQPQSK